MSSESQPLPHTYRFGVHEGVRGQQEAAAQYQEVDCELIRQNKR